MEPWHLDDQATIYHGDCLEVLRELPDASVDSVVTDPPYGLEFMGKEWDAFAPRDRKNATVWDGRRQAQSGWTEAAAERSGKGGGGPSYRSTHKGAKRCRLCGKRAFSGSPCICDQPEWVIEHRQEAPAAMLGFQAFSEAWAREAYRVLKPGGHLLAFGGTRTWHRLAVAIEDAGFEIRDSIAWMYGSGFPKSLDVSKAIDKAAGAERATKRVPYSTNVMQQGIGVERPWMKAAAQAGFHEVASDAPATPDAARWQGWGTALKPAHEPVVVARKPLTGTVAANVLEHGTGALNIDGCRIEGGQRPLIRNAGNVDPRGEGFHGKFGSTSEGTTTSGRWPANVVLDEDQAAALDRQSGYLRPATSRTHHRNRGPFHSGAESIEADNVYQDGGGGASRFFYVAKAPARERPKVDGIAHPTVKPLTLMRWLCRLVTPPGGVVLEPFAGSGTTIEAALMEGFRVVAIEREPDYLPLIAARLERVAQEPDDGQLTFDASA